MTSLALPRPRARRRRIKPPHPFWYLTLACVVWSAVCLAWSLFHLSEPHEFALAATNACWLVLWWPKIRVTDRVPPFTTRDDIVLRVGWGFWFLALILSLAGT